MRLFVFLLEINTKVPGNFSDKSRLKAQEDREMLFSIDWKHEHSPTDLAFITLFSLSWSSPDGDPVRKTQQHYLTHPLPNRKSNKSPFLLTLTPSSFCFFLQRQKENMWSGGGLTGKSILRILAGQSTAEQLRSILIPCVKTTVTHTMKLNLP